MKAKRTLSLLTAVMMLAAMLGGLGQTAAAAETVQTDPYTLSIQNWDFDTGTGVNQWLGLVTSPFWVEVETTGNGGGENETVLFLFIQLPAEHRIADNHPRYGCG